METELPILETMRGVNRQPKKVIRVSQIDLIESDSDDEDVSFLCLNGSLRAYMSSLGRFSLLLLENRSN